MDAVLKDYVETHSTSDAKGPNIKIQKTGAEVSANFIVAARF